MHTQGRHSQPSQGRQQHPGLHPPGADVALCGAGPHRVLVHRQHSAELARHVGPAQLQVGAWRQGKKGAWAWDRWGDDQDRIEPSIPIKTMPGGPGHMH